jgi:hypothetical protein
MNWNENSSFGSELFGKLIFVLFNGKMGNSPDQVGHCMIFHFLELG